jgi:hypothetical protein
VSTNVAHISIQRQFMNCYYVFLKKGEVLDSKLSLDNKNTCNSQVFDSKGVHRNALLVIYRVCSVGIPCS